MRRLGAASALVALGVLLGTTTATGAKEPAVASLRTVLPLVVVDVRGAIPDGKKVTARMRVVGNSGRPNTIRDRGNVYDGLIGIEIRGTSSTRYAKKSFAVETRNAAGKKRNVSLLGMPSENDWILYASYNDKTLMRNVVAHWTARQLGRYSSRTRFVELVLNGRYEGVYVLMERVKLDRNRVRLSNVGIDGAYLLELTTNRRVQNKPDGFFRLPMTGKPAEFRDPKQKRLKPAEQAWIKRYVGQFERALYGETFADPVAGYRRFLDVPSAVDYVLLNELFKNQDAMMTSTFVGKGSRSKLRLGPIWDFDLSMGNTTFFPGGQLEGWMLKGRPWTVRLYRDPAFAAAMAQRWRQLRSQRLLERIFAHVDANVRTLEGAQQRNFARWPILGRAVWSGPVDPATGEYPKTYAREVGLLKWWLTRRAAWMDANIGTLGTATGG